MEQVIGREQDLEVGAKAWEKCFYFFESGANVSTLSRQILRVSTSENTPPNLRSQISSLSAILSAKVVRCKKGCFGSQVCLYQDLNVNPDHDSTTTIEAVVKCVLVHYTTKSQSNKSAVNQNSESGEG
jgi:hypothetical protein